MRKFVVVDWMERKYVLTPMAIKKSSKTNKEVKKVKEETTNLKFDVQSQSTIQLESLKLLVMPS